MSIFHKVLISGKKAGMDVKQIRSRNLRRLIAEHEEGNTAALARRIGTDPAYLYQILSPTIPRQLGDALARRIEKVYRLKRGSMDSLPESDTVEESVLNLAKRIEALSNGRRAALEALIESFSNGNGK